MVIGYTYSIYTVRGVYNHKSGHIDSRERSWCVMVCRDRSTDVRFCVRRTTLFGPFLLIFVDFHHSRLTSIFSHSNLLKMSQISKCYSSSSLSSIKILSSMIDSKFQRKQIILIGFSIFAIKKRSGLLR